MTRAQRTSPDASVTLSDPRFIMTPAGRLEQIDSRTVIDMVSRIASATTLEDAWALGTAALGAYGFDRINYGFTRFLPAANKVGDPADALFLTNHSLEHVRNYFESGFFQKTPMFRWVTENVGACSWRWAHKERAAGRLSDIEIKAMDENIKAGVRAGYSVSFPPTSSRSKGVIGLTARVELDQDQVDAIWEAHSEEILAIVNTLHLKITQLPHPVQRRPLTDRQRQALEWVADGKTTQDIALLMDISPAMVEKHLRLAREALSVETTAQAVAKASFFNQIFVLERGKDF
jgi:DNA-binding CsgD family transcriptional regulator